MKKNYLLFGHIQRFNLLLKRRLKRLKKHLMNQFNLDPSKLKSLLLYDNKGRLKKAAFIISSTFISQGALAQSFEKVSTVDNPFVWDAENYELAASDDKYFMYFEDLDGDDSPELIMAHFFEYSVYSTPSNLAENTTLEDKLNAIATVDSDNHMIWGDLDGDNDLDFVGYDDDAEEYLFVENTGSATVPVFETTATNPFSGLTLGDDPMLALVDLDGDGDLDLYSCDKYGDAKYFENQGSSTSANFVEQTGTDNPFDGLESVNPAGNNGGIGSPLFVDIDKDGDLDLLISNLDADLKFYENTGNSTTPSFSVNTSYFEDLDALSIEQYAVADIDNDGVNDILVSNDDNDDIFQILNLGTSANPDFSFKRGSALNDYVVPELVDIDNDDDFDVIIASDDNFEIMQNNGSSSSPSFSYINTTDIFFAVGAYYTEQLRVVDLDDDQDYDLLSSEAYDAPELINNDGSPTSPDFGGGGSDPFSSLTLESGSLGHFIDIDGDDDFDYFNVGSSTSEYYRNDGNSTSPNLVSEASNPLSVLNSYLGDISSYDFVDLDKDMDFDLVVTTITGNSILYFENTGNATTASFQLATGTADPFNGLTIDGESRISFGDVDNDNDDDFILGKTDGTIDYYLNSSPISGILSYGKQLELTVFPNPTKQNINIVDIEDGSYQLTNISGEVVKEGVVGSSIDISELDPGTYILSVTRANGVYTSKIQKL